MFDGSIFGKINDQYAELWKAIIRPPRDVYDVKDLGPPVFSMGNRTYQRTDTTLLNPKGERLVCSHFEPIPTERKSKILPCVIYLHGNCSSRLEALSTIPVLLPLNITIFCFDFAGSGLSDGEYVSLGYHEREDLGSVVEMLRESGTVSCIGIWGRSMGAVTALLHGDRDPSIAGMVLDSPFADLQVLAEELVEFYINVSIPKFLLSGALQMIRMSIQQRCEFDIKDLVPIRHVDSCYIPALFTAAYNDNFIRPHHAPGTARSLRRGQNFVMIEGDHNSPRSRFFMDSVAIFFLNALRIDVQLPSPLEHRIPIGEASRPSENPSEANGSVRPTSQPVPAARPLREPVRPELRESVERLAGAHAVE